MRILITNPSGRIGSRIIPELLAPEFSVRVLARNPAQLPPEIRDHVEIVRGSPSNAVELRQALAGVEALLWCMPAESRQETNVARHYERFACAAWQAIRDACTPKVVTISAAGTDPARRDGPIAGLRAMEEILHETGAAIRHLRCGFFMDNFLAQAPSILERGLFSYPIAGDLPIPMVAAADVADAALRLLVRRDWEGIEAVAVHGPEGISFDWAAIIFQSVLGRPVRYEASAANQFVQSAVGQAASTEYARGQVEMFAGLARGIGETKPGSGKTGAPTTLAKWAKKELLPWFESGRGCAEPVAASLPAQDLLFHQNHDRDNGSSNHDYETQRIP